MVVRSPGNGITVEDYKFKKYQPAEMMAKGEPYFAKVGSSHHEIPLIVLYGPGRFWKKVDDIVIVGESEDVANINDLRDILNERRNSNVFGRWYSKFSVDGEFGYIRARHLVEITKEEYEDERKKYEPSEVY